MRTAVAAAAALWVLAVPGGAEAKTAVLRIGHFPNLTHAQALVARAQRRFEEKLGGDGVVIEWKTFNAGPSAIEAIFAGSLDVAYIGPSPAVNGYVKSGGEALRVVAGAASGGAALVVRADAGIRTAEDFHGRKVAAPQTGNTQDVSLRSWLSKNGLKPKEAGGDVQVLPISNADQQTLFLKGEIDGAWTTEPWVSLLVEKANGQIYLQEASLWPDGAYATTLLVARKKFLDENPEIIRRLLEEHVRITRWMAANPGQAKEAIAGELLKETGKEIPPSVLESALARVHFTVDALPETVTAQAHAAHEAGYLKKKPDLSGLFELTILEDVLKSRD